MKDLNDLSELNPLQRKVHDLRVQQVPFKEIAERLGITVGAATSAASLGELRIKKTVYKEDSEDMLKEQVRQYMQREREKRPPQ